MPNENIELRSEEVQEILGQTPNKIIRWGTSILLTVVIAIIIGSWFFKYPDILVSPILVTSENPPSEVIARASGKIKQLFVQDNDSVQSGQVLALIENPAIYSDVMLAKQNLAGLKNYIFTFSGDIPQLPASQSLSLGDFNDHYTAFVKLMEEYRNFMDVDYRNRKILSVQDQIKKQKNYYAAMQKQTKIQEQELKLEEKQFRRDSMLYIKKVNAEADYEKSQNAYLQVSRAYENSKASLSSILLQMNQLEQTEIELKLQYSDTKKNYEISLKEAYQNLCAQIIQWELMFVLKAPSNGCVAFVKFWSASQNIGLGEKAFTIVPRSKGHTLGKIKLPVLGSGKVKCGQTVNIKLINYPDAEFGMLRGTVKSISAVPVDDNYLVEISMPDSLVTNYGKRIPFGFQLQGNAEIITEDLRLFERFIQPIRAIVKNR